MTIHQLIRELQAYPPALRVMVDAYEGDKREDSPTVSALILRRPRRHAGD